MPASKKNMAIDRPSPLDVPVTTAYFTIIPLSGIALNLYIPDISRLETCTCPPRKNPAPYLFTYTVPIMNQCFHSFIIAVKRKTFIWRMESVIRCSKSKQDNGHLIDSLHPFNDRNGTPHSHKYRFFPECLCVTFCRFLDQMMIWIDFICFCGKVFLFYIDCNTRWFMLIDMVC